MIDSIIRDFLLEPLTQLFAGLYTAIQIFVPSYGISIIVLSVVTAIIMLPIERRVRASVLNEKKIESILTPQLDNIKKIYKGAEQTLAIKRLYSRYSYSPFYAIRNIYFILIQLPFLIGAYLMLSENQDIQGGGVSFLFLNDLGREDKLLFGLNMMPLLMTAINLLTLYFLNLSKKENYQAIAIALFFCVLLYKAPSALLLYWTMNNVIHLVRAIYKKTLKKQFNDIYNITKKRINSLSVFFLYSKKYSDFKKYFLDSAEKEFFKNSWRYYLYLIVIAAFVIISFNNIGLYSLETIFRSIFIILLITSAIILVLSIIKKMIQKTSILRILFVYTILFLGYVFFYKKITYCLQGHIYFVKTTIILITTVLFISIFLLGRFKLLNKLIILFIVIFTGSCLYENHVATNEYLKGIKTYSIQLKEKPNIYYILCESMNSTEIAVKTYGLPAKEKESFENYLKANDFTIPGKLYSNGNNTLMTLQTIFSMTDFAKGVRGNLEAPPIVRRMITGGKDNTLLKILKDNGYHTSEALYADGYFGTVQGPLLDYYDSGYKYNGLMPIINFNKFFARIVTKLKLDNKPTVRYKTSTEFFKDYFENEPIAPHFLCYRLSHTFHAGTYAEFNRQEWLRDSVYRNEYEKEIQDLKNITSTILKHDPDSIIILCGDHGAWLYWQQFQSKSELKEYLKEAKITYEDFINDKYKVFAAIRIPHKYGKIEELWSPGNIFAKIFTVIGYKGDTLNISNNFSYYHDNSFSDMKKPIIKEGNIVNLSELE